MAGLGLVMAVSLVGAVVNFTAANLAAGIAFTVLGVAAASGTVFLIRREIRRVMKSEGRPMPRP